MRQGGQVRKSASRQPAPASSSEPRVSLVAAAFAESVRAVSWLRCVSWTLRRPLAPSHILPSSLFLQSA